MKPQFTIQRNHAWSGFELLVVVLLTLLLLCLLFAMLLPARMAKHRRTQSNSNRVQLVNCVNNLKQIGLAFRIWAGDHNNQYPMQVPVAGGGAMELIATGDVAGCFQVISNELNTTEILVCPADRGRVPAANFTDGFDNSHVSYFLSQYASETYPQTILDGDDNLAIDGAPVKPGVLDLSTNDSISWTMGRHGRVNNIGYADGAVMELSTPGLQSALQYSVNGTPATTNRLAIP